MSERKRQEECFFSIEEIELKQLTKYEYVKTELKTGIFGQSFHEYTGLGLFSFAASLMLKRNMFVLLCFFNKHKAKSVSEFSQSCLFSVRGLSFPLSLFPRAESF